MTGRDIKLNYTGKGRRRLYPIEDPPRFAQIHTILLSVIAFLLFAYYAVS